MASSHGLPAIPVRPEPCHRQVQIPMNRRTFISSIAAAGTALAAGSRLLAGSHRPRCRVGLIGCGWYGGNDLENFQRNAEVEVVSLCDVNSRNLQAKLQAVAAHQQAVPKTFSDYRVMLEAVGHDVVIVGTPDHWHA